MKEIDKINLILDKSNEELKPHSQYQDWMHFDGADVMPLQVSPHKMGKVV